MRKDLQELLQECLEGYEAGLTPEECLSAYPDARDQLEPLLRQALSLRFAYASTPRAEFRLQAREKLLFAAGRDVTQALTAEPDPEFVESTRRRLLNRAGADAQEALRDVPPPRLPFWVNARRRLLEAASSAPPRPQAQPGVGAVLARPFVMRTALSAAVVVLAVVIAGAGFFAQNTPANEPVRSALSAELDYIVEGIRTAEQRTASGEPVSSSFLDDLAERTSRLAEVYASALDSELKESLPDLIERQRSLAESRQMDDTLALAQARLAEADEKVSAATAATDPETASTDDTTTATSEVTPEAPTAVPTQEPTVTPALTEGLPEFVTVNPADLGPKQIVTQYEPNERSLDRRWWLTTTSSLTFLMPESWTITNLQVDPGSGLTIFESNFLFVETDIEGIRLVISMDGAVDTIIDDQQRSLRSAGVASNVIDPAELAELTAEVENWPSLYFMLTSLRVMAEETSTPTQSVESTSTEQASPEPSDTPEAIP